MVPTALFASQCSEVWLDYVRKSFDPETAVSLVDRLTQVALENGYDHKPQIVGGDYKFILMADPLGQSSFVVS